MLQTEYPKPFLDILAGKLQLYTCGVFIGKVVGMFQLVFLTRKIRGLPRGGDSVFIHSGNSDGLSGLGSGDGYTLPRGSLFAGVSLRAHRTGFSLRAHQRLQPFLLRPLPAALDGHGIQQLVPGIEAQFAVLSNAQAVAFVGELIQYLLIDPRRGREFSPGLTPS